MIDDNEQIIERPRYNERIAPYIGLPLVKVITGQRRVGKSWFLKSLKARFKRERPDRPIVFIDKERPEWDRVRTGEEILAVVREAAGDNSAFVMIDEVQEIGGFERALRHLAGEGKHDVYVTGSNAFLLSGEIATLFAGRAVAVRIHGLCYDEFLVFHSLSDSEESLTRYLRYGGLPFLRNLDLRDEVVFEYLRGVFDTVVLKDVVMRRSVRNPALLERLVHYVADSVGSPVSARNISSFLKSQRVELSHQTVLDYLSFLCDAFFLNRTQRMEIKGRKTLKIGEKYYFEDLGLRTVLRGWSGGDLGKIVENAVFLRLAADGWLVRTGAQAGKEIDFVCERGTETLYVQAAYLVADRPARDREFANLLALPDNHPKMVVSMDPVRADERGVRHLGLGDFLRGRYDART